MKSLIQKLTESHSPSGYEQAIREVIREEIKPLADDLRVDALGSLIAKKNPSPVNQKSKRVMLVAHMDEIGLIATHIDENGFIRFTTLGGVRTSTLRGGRVRFMNGTAGIIGSENVKDLTKAYSLDELFIDVGATSRKDCPIKIGDTAAFDRPYMELGNRLVAKSLDDRIGCAILIECMRSVKNWLHEVYFVFSTQEEVGVRGATTSAFGIDPEFGLAVDVTGVGDTPKGPKMAVSLGKGPAIKIKDAGMLTDPRVVDLMIRAAEKAKIPYQREVLEGGSTDARAVQLTRAGVPTGCISIPCRYVHTPSEMVDLDDVHNAVKLLVTLISAPLAL